MAIIEKVTLVDDYSSKAKKITASTSAMASAMDSIRGNASKMGSALKSAFSRSYKVDIKDIGSNRVNNSLNMIQGKLDKLNKPYNIEITAKDSALSKLKSNLTSIKDSAKSIKKPLNNAFASARSFKMDLSTFRAANREARNLERELKNLTGKRHKVNIDMENPMKSAFKNGFSKMFGGLKSGLSKLNPFKGFGGGDSGGGGDGGPGLIKSIVGGNLITGAITKGLGAVTSVASSTIGAGAKRLGDIQSAKARLRGQVNADGSRKFDNAAIESISDSAMKAVTGTAYGYGDAMSTASSAIAANVKPEKLEGYLKGVANISAATGSEFNDIGAIMNKIQTTGKLQGDELMQLSDRGLPILSKIAEMKGVDDNTAREMVSKGQISAEDAFKAATLAAGNSAEEMGKTWEGAKMNFGAALSKLGAGLLGGSGGEEGGLFGAMTPALLKVNEVLNGLIPSFQKVGDTVSGFVSGGFEKAKDGFAKVGEFLGPAKEKFQEGFGNLTEKIGEVIEPLKEKFSAAFETLGEAFAPVKDAFSNILGDGVEGGFDILGSVVDIVAGAFGVLADVIVALNPVWQLLASFITGVVFPAFQMIGSFIVGSVVPAFQTIAEMVGGLVKAAFEQVSNAVNVAKAAFDTIKGAIATAVDAFFSIPGKIASALSGIGGAVWDAVTSWIPGKKKNATGTDYFSGGLTQINEQGQEMMRLPTGTKIYPAGATRRAIEKEARAVSPVPNNGDSGRPIVININGANMTNNDVGRVISNELKRLGVVV